MKKAAVHNLGCKVNSYELDVMTQKLKEDGYEIVPFDEKADVYVINTCTVTNIADRKSRQMLHRAKALNKDAVVVAVGCYVETDEAGVEQDPAIDLAIGNNRKGEIAQILEAYLKSRGEGNPAEKTLGGATLEDISKTPLFEDMQLRTPGRTRADIKIQDGCNQFCSYCIIPYARGRIRSRDPLEIQEEITALAQEGVKEVVLTGIHIGSYGKEKGLSPDKELLSLLTRIQMIRGIERIRLGSLEPRIMTENFVRGISGLSKLCPHFHLSLQSGCDRTLHRMNRHYTAKEYYDSVVLLRKYFDRPAITTDVIVGFPGETEDEFEESRAFCEKVGFYEIHVFKYSVRHGTVAAGLPDQKTNAQKAARSDVLLALTKEQAERYRAGFIGQEEELLLEEEVTLNGERFYKGHTKRYVEGILTAEAAERVAGDAGLQSPCGMLVKGTLLREAEGTACLRMDPGSAKALKSDPK